MNALLLILNLIPISTPPSIDRNSALIEQDIGDHEGHPTQFV